MKKNRIFSEKERHFLRDNIPGRSFTETADLFNTWIDEDNSEHGTPIVASQVRAFSKNHKIPNGRDTRFKKGQVAHNKGKYCRHSQASEFKKGNVPANHRPTGSTRTSVDGYIEIKVAEPRKWRQLHRVVWEESYGPVPKGHVVIFGDGNKQNVTLENLLLVTRSELARLNQRGLFGGSAELTKTGILVARLINKISSAKRKGKDV